MLSIFLLIVRQCLWDSYWAMWVAQHTPGVLTTIEAPNEYKRHSKPALPQCQTIWAQCLMNDPSPILVSTYFPWTLTIEHGQFMVSVGPFVYYVIGIYIDFICQFITLSTMLMGWSPFFYADNVMGTPNERRIGHLVQDCVCLCGVCVRGFRSQSQAPLGLCIVAPTVRAPLRGQGYACICIYCQQIRSGHTPPYQVVQVNQVHLGASF